MNENQETMFELTYIVDGQVCYSEMVEKGKRLSAAPKPVKDNYVFSGWDKIPSRMPARNVEIHGSFAPAAFSLTFVSGGEEISREEVPFGSPVTAPEAPAREGAAFLGWKGLPETMPAADVTVEAEYDFSEYNVTYTITDATGHFSPTSFTFPCKFGAPIPEMDVPCRPYYTFSGWGDIPETMPAHDVTFTGALALTLYKLTRIVDGEVFREELLPFGAPVSKKPNPEKEGYYFSGFRSLPKTMPDHDVEVVSSMYPARFKADFLLDDLLYRSVYIPFGSPVEEVPEVPEGKQFLGWDDCPETMPAHDVEVHGRTCNAGEAPVAADTDVLYTLTFVADGETVSTARLAAGAPIECPDAPAKAGYTFLTWNDQPDVMPAADLTLLAVYEASVFHIEYVIDGVIVNEFAHPTGAVLEAPAAPEKEGYSFGGWINAPETMPDYDVTVQGEYEVNTYTVTFVCEGTEDRVAHVAFGQPIEAPACEAGWVDLPETMPARDLVVKARTQAAGPAVIYLVDGSEYARIETAEGTAPAVPETAPVKEGCTFTGWTGLPETMPAGDVTVEAAFETNSYRVSFVVEDKTAAEITVPFGAPVAVPADLAVDSPAFSGWRDLPSAMPAEDVTVTAAFDRAPNVLRFHMDGELFWQDKVFAGAPVSHPAVPAKPGYTFAGWHGYLPVMPAEDLTVSGFYIPHSHTVTYRVDGETFAVTNVLVDAAPAFDGIPVKEGFTFAGWTELPEAMPDEDLTADAVWTPAESAAPAAEADGFLYRFMVSGEVFLECRVPAGQSCAEPAAPHKFGYTFDRWDDIPAAAESDTVIHAHFKPNLHHLIFLLDDVAVADRSVGYGDPVILSSDVPSEGVVGWKGLPSVMPDNDVVVIGIPAGTAVKVTATVDGVVVLDDYMDPGQPLVLPELPAKDGYEAPAWDEAVPAVVPENGADFHCTYKSVTHTVSFVCCGEEYAAVKVPFGAAIPAPALSKEIAGVFYDSWADLPETMPDEDITVYAVGRMGSVVTFLSDGNPVGSVRAIEGHPISCPEPPAKEGYTFVRWDGLDHIVEGGETVAEAVYEPNTYRLTYSVKGMPYKHEDLVFGTPISPIKAPAVKKRVFVKWCNLPSTMPAGDLVSEGLYVTQNTFLLSYQIDGEPYAEAVLEPQTKIIAPTPPEKAGYVFSGWDKNVTVIGREPITVKGSYIPLEKTLTYYVDGEVYATYTVNVGQPLPVPEAPQTALTFRGWTRLPVTMPDCDLRADAIVGVNYTVAFLAGGEKLSELTLQEGTAVVAPEAPERIGYTFEGWDNLPEVAVANTVCTAKYKPNVYNAAFTVDGKVIVTVPTVFGRPIEIPAAPEVEGMNFLGWDNLPETMPAEDVTVAALFEEIPAPEPVEEPVEEPAPVVVAVEEPAEEPAPAEEPEAVEEPAEEPAPEVVEEPAPVFYTALFTVNGEAYATYELLAGEEIPTPDDPTERLFVGWAEHAATMPEEDITVAALLKPVYTVSFLVEGDKLAEVSVPEGDAVTLPAAPEKAGYTFRPWQIPEHITEDLTLDAGYEPLFFALTYAIEGRAYATYQVACGEALPTPVSPEGFFPGWEEAPEIMPAEDVTVNAIIPENVEIRFVIDGEEAATQSLRPGTAVIPPEAPAKKGFRFVGWNAMPEIALENTECTAEFAEIPAEPEMHKLTFTVNGEVYATADVLTGTPLTMPEEPVVPGMEFVEWMEAPAAMPDADLTLDARLRLAMCNVTFLLDGEEYSSAKLLPGTGISAPDAPPKEGYTFNGWDGIPATMPRTDLVVEGSYSPNEHEVRFMVGKKIYSTARVPFGTVIPLPEEPTKEKRTFTKWEGLPETMPDKDVKVQAVFVLAFKVAFVLDGEVISESLLAPKDKIVAPEIPEKYGHSFSGWSEFPVKMKKEALTITGSMVPNVHTVSYVADDTVISTETVAFGAPILPTEGPALEGRRFVDWGCYPETMPDEDITLVGRYDPLPYKVIFLLDDIRLDEMTLRYGEPIVGPAAPRKVGYTFSGWIDLPETMPATSVTVSGTYTINTHKVTYLSDKDVFFEAEYDFGEEIPMPLGFPTAPKTRLLFSNWDLEPTVMGDEDLVINAVFASRRELRKKMKTVTFKADRKTVYSEKVLPGRAIPLPQAPEKAKLVFDHWDKLPATGKMPAEDLTCTAVYVKKTGTAIFVAEGEEVCRITLEADASISAPAAPEKTGMTFARWDNLPDVMPAYTFTSSAVYDKTKYKVAFYRGNELIKEQLYPWGEEILPTSLPATEDAVFEGWEGLPAVMPMHDIDRVTAVFHYREFQVTYVIDEHIVTDRMVTCHDPILPPSVAERDGQAIIRWINMPADGTMPAHDLVLEAVWGDPAEALSPRERRKLARAARRGKSIDGKPIGDDELIRAKMKKLMK